MIEPQNSTDENITPEQKRDLLRLELFEKTYYSLNEIELLNEDIKNAKENAKESGLSAEEVKLIAAAAKAELKADLQAAQEKIDQVSETLEKIDKLKEKYRN